MFVFRKPSSILSRPLKAGLFRPSSTVLRATFNAAVTNEDEHLNRSRELDKSFPRCEVTEKSILQAAKWSKSLQSPDELSRFLQDPSSRSLVSEILDRVMRPEASRVAAYALTDIVTSRNLPSAMPFFERILLHLGSSSTQLLPEAVISATRHRVFSMVSPFLRAPTSLDLNRSVPTTVSLAAGAPLGRKSAEKRKEQVLALIEQESVRNVAINVAVVAGSVNKWDQEAAVQKILSSMRPLFLSAKASNPSVFITLDMDDYAYVRATVEAFVRLLSDPEFADIDAGIALQTYLPETFSILQRLVTWANERPGNGSVKIRLVKGANLSIEKVDAELKGWSQAPYESKSDTDANYLRCLDWVLTQERTQRVQVAVASHNLFFLAYGQHLADSRGVESSVSFEMLDGMVKGHAETLSKEGLKVSTYSPVSPSDELGISLAYLFRRFDELSSEGHFLNSLPTLVPDSPSFRKEEHRFRTAVAKKNYVKGQPRRFQTRPAPASHLTLSGLRSSGDFVNEPDSDPSIPEVQRWGLESLDRSRFKPARSESWVQSTPQAQEVLERARHGSHSWSAKSTADRSGILKKTADILAARRGDVMNAMVFEGLKTIAEADPEISEAVDFANYYALMAEQLPENFEKFGVVTVAGPWNFPSAIPGGGAFAALAAGNSVILKPSPHTPRCTELVAECAWEAGVPKNVLQFVQFPEDDVGKYIMTESDAVILTGSSDTAKIFRSWKSDMKLFAEEHSPSSPRKTSGKNALIITPAADVHMAVRDAVHSAFSNSGQKCSASSLLICVGEVYQSKMFREMLSDAVESLRVGQSWEVMTNVGPLRTKPNQKLHRALTSLDIGEEWLVEPRCLNEGREGNLWTPGVRLGVKNGSWFHRTEVFGPVLGVMHASTLEEAVSMQNGTSYGLTGGIHTLDNEEIKYWEENIQVGNAYVNRGTTGAIVRRQCFGGWKDSNVGPGAKAGGPNYVAQLGIIHDKDSIHDEQWLARAMNSDEREWKARFSVEDDPTGLRCESNKFRYRPLSGIAVRLASGSNGYEAERVRAGIMQCGVPIVAWSTAADESAEVFAKRLSSLGVERVRVLGEVEPVLRRTANALNTHLADAPVLGDGRYELLHYLREQTIAKTLHRFGRILQA